MKGSISISKLNQGNSDGIVRITIRRAGDLPRQRIRIAIDFEGFARALLGESEVEIEIEEAL